MDELSFLTVRSVHAVHNAKTEGMASLVVIPLRICRRRTNTFVRTPTNVHVKARRNAAAGRNVHVRRGTNMNFTYGCTGLPLIMTNSTGTANIVHSTISTTPYELLLGVLTAGTPYLLLRPSLRPVLSSEF